MTGPIRLKNLYFAQHGIFNGIENARNEKEKNKIILKNLESHKNSRVWPRSRMKQIQALIDDQKNVIQGFLVV